MMQIAVCDDEEIVREQIKELIIEQKKDCQVVQFVSGEELLAAHESFDLIFLDIQLDGMTGIEVAREFRNRGDEVFLIFVTGAKEYIFDAFDVSAFQYLLKPISEKRFSEIFARAKRELEKKKHVEPLIFKIGGRHVRVKREQILYAESKGRKAGIHTKQEELEIYADMKSLEGQLGEAFACCHKGLLVNMGYIQEYDRDKILLTNGQELYLSRRKSGEFVKKYLQYLRKGGKLLG